MATQDLWTPECRCWCYVRPVVCTLSCCACVVHTDRPPVACIWCVQADPGLICQADLGGQCPPSDLGGNRPKRSDEKESA